MQNARVSDRPTGRAIPRPKRGPAEIVPFAPASRPPSPTQMRFVRGARAIIFKPSPSATQAGRGAAQDWVLEFEPISRPRPDHLMGWWGGGDTLSQVRLRFPSRESAERFARRQGLDWMVIEPAPAARRPKLGWTFGEVPTDFLTDLIL